MKAVYTKHHFNHPEGHISLDKPGPCTITLQGAAAMSQEELDYYGEIVAKALAEARSFAAVNIPVALAELMEGWDDECAVRSYQDWKAGGGSDNDSDGFDKFLSKWDG